MLRGCAIVFVSLVAKLHSNVQLVGVTVEELHSLVSMFLDYSSGTKG